MRFSPPSPSIDHEDASPPSRRPLRVTGWLGATGRLGRRRPLTTLMAAGVTSVLLCFGIGLGTDSRLLTMGWGSDITTLPTAEKADKERAAADKALARKLAAANAADAEAAAQRAADARKAQAEAARRQVVAMPALVGLKLSTAMDVAAEAGLTAVTVCRTPDGDTPLWWPNWRITGQDVPPGRRTSADKQICVSATK